MTTLLTDEYKWAVAYNNAGSLALVSTTIPSGDKPFNFRPGEVVGNEVLALPNYSLGVRKIRGNGRSMFSGYSSTIWKFGAWTLPQYLYLQTTFCGGAGHFDGLVTIRTTTGGVAYANYNAVMNIPQPSEMEYDGLHYIAPIITYTRMVAL